MCITIFFSDEAPSPVQAPSATLERTPNAEPADEGQDYSIDFVIPDFQDQPWMKKHT
jgi:hypothetical protein